MIIITFSILFLTAGSIIIDPINQTCIGNSSFSVQYNNQLKLNLHLFHLQPFSQSIFKLDLRHLIDIPKIPNSVTNQSCFKFYAIIYQNKIQEGVMQTEIIQNIQAQQNKYLLYVDRDTWVSLYFQITQGYQAYKYLLYNSVSFDTVIQNSRLPEQKASFLFIISSFDAINLPFNRPNAQRYNGYYINKITQGKSANNQSGTVTSNSYWTTFNSIAVPFIPYISNCNGEGDKMFISQLMGNQSDCNLIPVQDTKPIDQFKFGSIPVADNCHIKRECVYDEKVGSNMQFPYWQTLVEGKTLFSITKKKINYQQYQINTVFDQNQLVPCVINESKGTNSSEIYPLNVKITLEYYQVTKQVKTMISCAVTFSLYMESSNNFPYQLQIQTKPLNHTYIMLNFGFEWYVYMIVFVIIGAISNVQNLLLWLFHNFVSKKDKKQFRIKIYMRVIGQIFKGTFIALIFCTFLLIGIAIIMNGKIFNLELYSSNLDRSVPRVFWDYLNSQLITDYESDLAIKYRSGRMGLSYLVVGSVLLFYTSKFFIGCEKKSKQYNDYQIMGRILKPRQWNRGKFIFGTYVYICIQFFFIYFAYSKVYSENIWTFIVLMKIIQIIMQQITLSIYQDLLPCLPLKVITEITAYMNTLSADNLYDFLFSFLIDVAITMIQKAYIPQLQNILFEKINQKMQQILKFYAHLTNDSEAEVKQAVDEQKQEQEQQNQFVLINSQAQQVKFFNNQQIQTYNEDSSIQLKQIQVRNLQRLISHKFISFRRYENKQNQNSHNNHLNSNQANQQNLEKSEQQIIQQATLLFEMLLDNILLFFTFLLQPFVILVYWITYDQSGVLNTYGISEGVVILYMLSAIVVAIFTIMNMIMIFHLLQSYLEVDFQEKITRLLNRFASRKLFWKAHDQDLNKQIQVASRGADHYCLSWQLFFILAIYISSMVLVMLGITIMINAKYNPFQDSTVSLVALFWFFFVISAIWIIKKAAYKFNIDGWRDFDNNSKNSNAISDYSKKQKSLNKNENNQDTNHPFGLHETSQHELIGSKIFLNRSRKYLEKKGQEQIKNIGNNIANNSESDSQNSQISQQTLNIKLNQICKKLQPRFKNNKFNMNYFQRNKQFLKANIEKVLPLIQQLPQINQYRIPTNSINSTDINIKKQNKAYDPSILQMITKWRVKTDLMAQERLKKGRQSQKQLNSCSFCFQSWAVYYGFGGTCFKCSHQIQESRKKKLN